MEFQLSRFSLNAPSVALAYWFLSCDFADAFGLEYSRDAARELKQLVGHLAARVDYEADTVTLRIKRNENVIPTLRAIYARLHWDAAELRKIEATVLAYKRPRAKKIAAGDTFLIPIADGVYGLGQVLEVQYRAPTVAVFRCVGPAADIERNDPASLRPLAILHLGRGCSLFTGGWPVIASHRVRHSPAGGTTGARDTIGAISWGDDGYTVELLRAHAGLDTWEQDFADPDWLRKHVLE
jgi:hypothetical protein